MNIIVGCEKSQTVCKAFRERGHNAFSCDVDECYGGHPEWHIQADIRKVMNVKKYKWHLGIFHPPCTYITNCAAEFVKVEIYGKKAVERIKKRLDSAQFFMEVYSCNIKKKCVENPVGFMNHIIKPSQVIHPFFFGEAEHKRTCLWLQNLPPLVHVKEKTLFDTAITHVESKPYYISPSGKANYLIEAHNSGHNKKRSDARSKTFQSIANAMAAQWG